MTFVIREGDPTTTGGKVLAGSTTTTVEYRRAARISDPVWCPKCNSIGFIAEGNPTFIVEGVAVATQGHAVQCGCPSGNNRLIATQSTLMAAEEGSVAITFEFAAMAQAATHVWAQAISNGSYTDEFVSDISTQGLSGLTNTDPCNAMELANNHIDNELSPAPTQAEAAAKPKNISPLQKRREEKREIFHSLVDLVEVGRGGLRALTGTRFSDTMGQLGVFMVKVEESDSYKNILRTAKGFKERPHDLINVLDRKESLFDFLNRHTARDINSENFCLQSMISDLSTWLVFSLRRQPHSFSPNEMHHLQCRLKRSTQINESDYAKNPASREPETTEEVLQYLYYAIGLFDDENSWVEYAKNMYTAEYPAIANLTYQRAATVYKRKKGAGDYS